MLGWLIGPVWRLMQTQFVGSSSCGGGGQQIHNAFLVCRLFFHSANESSAPRLHTVWLQTQAMRYTGLGPQRLSQSNLRDASWTVAQMITHHTANGFNLKPGDLLGSGTRSGAEPKKAGSLLELSLGGKKPLTLANCETRTILDDGDPVTLRAHYVQDGFRRIGFGD